MVPASSSGGGAVASGSGGLSSGYGSGSSLSSVNFSSPLPSARAGGVPPPAGALKNFHAISGMLQIRIRTIDREGLQKLSSKIHDT